ncbi:MAG: hypothetical protein JNK73_04160 [Bacteroidia bacterium]|nr:hypothetical protein [Bacteroidia bacterium]
MKLLKTLVLLCLCSFAVFAFMPQTEELLSQVPKTREEFVESEKKTIATIDWLENTPIHEQTEKRKKLNALLLAWITNSPTVTIELQAELLEFSKKNNALLMYYMGGWTKYALLNNYSTDQLKCNLAALRSVCKAYKTGDFTKDKNVQKLLDLDEKGKLEGWIQKQLAK